MQRANWGETHGASPVSAGAAQIPEDSQLQQLEEQTHLQQLWEQTYLQQLWEQTSLQQLWDQTSVMGAASVFLGAVSAEKVNEGTVEWVMVWLVFQVSKFLSFSPPLVHPPCSFATRRRWHWVMLQNLSAGCPALLPSATCLQVGPRRECVSRGCAQGPCLVRRPFIAYSASEGDECEPGEKSANPWGGL